MSNKDLMMSDDRIEIDILSSFEIQYTITYS